MVGNHDVGITIDNRMLYRLLHGSSIVLPHVQRPRAQQAHSNAPRRVLRGVIHHANVQLRRMDWNRAGGGIADYLHGMPLGYQFKGNVA